MYPDDEKDYKVFGENTELKYCIDGEVRGRTESVYYLMEQYDMPMIRAYRYLNRLKER